MAAKPKVLISGAGPGGTVLAYWLAKHGFEIVILERSSSRRSVGQIIDVEGPSQEIVRRMGLLEKLKAMSTHEEGLRIVSTNGDSVAEFPTGSIGISNEIEILRSDLANAFFDAAESQSNIDIRLGHTIQSLQQTSTKAIATIHSRDNNTTKDEEFDILVASDGMRSTTRDLIIPPEERANCLKPLNAFVAFFSIPAKPASDGPLARVYTMPNRRAATIKPLNSKTSSAYLACLTSDTEAFQKAHESRDVNKQKQLMADLFRGEGWEIPRMIDEMMRTDDFYFESLAQIKLKKWSYGRCILLGDTAYAPSPLTGQGTNLAILGAYLLAHELVRNMNKTTKALDDDDDDNAYGWPTNAFEAYEGKMRPYVDKAQPIPLGGYLPYLINPKTSLGVWFLRLVVSFFAWLRIWRFIPDVKNVPFDLPDL